MGIRNTYPARWRDAAIPVHATERTACFCILAFVIVAGIPVTADDTLSRTGWVNTYPSCGSCEGYSIAPATDGGYLIAGTVIRSSESRDLLVLKTDAAGNEQWKVAGNGNTCMGTAVAQASTGTYAVAGGSCPEGTGSAAITLIDEMKGTILSAYDYDTGRKAIGTALLRTGDGECLLLTDVDTDAAGRNDRDVFICRIRSDGTIAWSRAFSGRYDDTGASALQSADGGFIIALTTDTGGNGGDDIVLVALDPDGGDRWVASVGRNDDEQAAGIAETDTGYLIAGTVCTRDREADCDFYAAGTDSE